MEPLYFNPTSIPSNYTGTNPLTDYSAIQTHQMQPSYFNPNLYNSFTFSLPTQSYTTNTTFVGSHTDVNDTTAGAGSATLGGNQVGNFSYQTVEFYSTVFYYSTQFSSYVGIYATDTTIQPVTFSYRFGTQLQTLYFSEGALTSYAFSYVNTFLQTYEYLSVAVETYYSPSGGPSWTFFGDTLTSSEGLQLGSLLEASSTSPFSISTITTPGYFTASSMFVNMLGSNVYTGLLVTTNSIIIYQNEQVSSYYSQSLSYQINIANLTTALNSVSGSSNEGQGTIPITTFSWSWVSVAGTGWTGSQVNVSLYNTTVNSYLSVNYGSNYTITNSSVAVTQVQSLITQENNGLSNSQTYLNNAVTTLQSQVSLAGQIIGSLASATQAIISNIA